MLQPSFVREAGFSEAARVNATALLLTDSSEKAPTTPQPERDERLAGP